MIFGGSEEGTEPAHRSRHVEPICAHEGFHEIRSSYDQPRGLLLFFWSCERCGARLNEARREPYRPAFDPRGNERFPGPGTVPG
jgi:hypothetical protein